MIATGETRPLQDFVAEAFAAVGLDWQDHVQADASLIRPADLRVSRANPALAASQLGWTAQTRMSGVVQRMVQASQDAATQPALVAGALQRLGSLGQGTELGVPLRQVIANGRD